jgi:hypothetical protein
MVQGCLIVLALGSYVSGYASQRALLRSAHGSRIRKSESGTNKCILLQREPLLALGYGELRNVDAQLMFDTWEWTANLGAPAALVAGAVLATMVESREAMSPKKSDTQLMRVAKKLCRFLLLSSFGLEVVSIFVTTVTGTMLLSHGDTPGTLKNLAYNSPMGFLKNNWEFEYLTARIAFLQGLFHWLASVALELYIPKEAEGVAARRMNKFTSSALATILVGMLSFLNRHMTFYKNYAHMLRCYVVVSFKMFFWPPHPLTILMAPMTIITLVLGFQAFMTSGDMEKD